MMPKQKPHRSKQDYQTPPELIHAIKMELGIKNFSIDLAASGENFIVPYYYCEEDNSLVQNWNVGGWGFCNPPYADIKPWVQKAYEEFQKGASIVMLLPASVGANWWRDWVHLKCLVMFLNGRIQFVGATGLYPKDCAVLVYSPLLEGKTGYKVWSWREHV